MRDSMSPPCTWGTGRVVGLVLGLLVGFVFPAHAALSTSTADSLCRLGTQVLQAGEVDRAEVLFVQALKSNNKHALAHCGLGHVYLRRADLSKARKAFRKAEGYERKLPEAYNGLGLVYARERGQWVRAIDYFCRALAERPDYVDAQYNIGMIHLNLMNRDAIKAFERVVEMNPNHPDAYYRLGYMYEMDLLKKDEATGFYEKQLEVSPSHKEAMWRLGQLYRFLSRTDQAARTLSHLMHTQGANQRQYMLELAEVYLEQEDYDKAETLFETYLANLPTQERMVYEDISPIAGEVLQDFAETSGSTRKTFLEQFWKRRDPTPITKVNERRVEHFRRVAYALEHYGEAVMPWDRRGEVYVRYGEPDHLSASRARKREFPPAVRAVKQQLLDRVGWAAEMLLKDYANADGDSIDATHRGAGAEQARRQLEGQLSRLRIRTRQSARGEQVRQRAESEMKTGGLAPFLGRPVFPIQDQRAWEYWTYVGVGEGVEIVFRQVPGAPEGAFDYAVLPGDMSAKMRLMWSPLQPEAVMLAAATERYVPQFLSQPLQFAAYPATFRGKADSTRVEIYFGFRASELTEDGQKVRLQRGAVLYDAKGDPVYSAVERSVFQIDGNAGIIPDMVALDVMPGSYYLAVQAVAETSGKTQVYGMPLRVRAYRSGRLRLSDIELAASVEPADEPGMFVKQDLQVIPLATRFYTQKNQVYLYYEIYSLTRDDFGQTDYQIAYTLRPRAASKLKARVLGGMGRLVGVDQKEEVVTISYDQTGSVEDVASYLAVDLAGSDSGEYVMEVVVTDRVSSETTSRTTSFKIE